MTSTESQPLGVSGAAPAGPRADLGDVRSVVRLTALIGGPLFLLTVILHPARDGYHIAAHPTWYEITHLTEAASLLIQAVCLAGVLALVAGRIRRRGLASVYTAIVGTVSWFGLIVFDGSHNPATAKYAPQFVHTSADLDLSATVIVLVANVLFPVGYAMLARMLVRTGARAAGLLLGIGAAVYSLGGTAALLGLGPHSVVTSVVEIAGAAPYALGYVLLARTFAS
ncbi:MAG TPA: hypothetical protein VF054_13520 [Micromonosporaceae bacterium]